MSALPPCVSQFIVQNRNENQLLGNANQNVYLEEDNNLKSEGVINYD